MATTAQIRQQILDAQQLSKPDWVWTTGEPLVDILDAVASFHQRREFVVDLTKNILNSETTLNTFSRLMNDISYRQQASAMMGLSLSTRTVVYAGVPADVSDDMDAFIWYYMDRYAEKKSFRRNTGGGSSARVYFKYANSITGSCSILFRNGDKLYKAVVSLNGNADPYDPTRNFTSGIVYSMGYGVKYNVPANSLFVLQVWGDITSPAALVGLTTDAMIGGSDYQSNESFLAELQANLGVGSGVGVRLSAAQIISNIDTIDKYLIVGTRSGLRFKGSMDIYIKGSRTEIWPHELLVGSDSRVLVPYQPSNIISVTLKGTPDILYVENTDYIVQTTTGDFLHSVRQQTYIQFLANSSNPVTPLVSVVILELEVDIDCMTANTAMNDYYVSNREYVRDWLVYQAQAQNFTVDLQVKTKIKIAQATLDALVLANIQAFIADFPMEDGTNTAKLDASDLINSVYDIVYQGQKVIDSVEMMVIYKVDSVGNQPAPIILQTTAENILANKVVDLGSLFLMAGYYWLTYNITVVNT